MTLGLGRGIPVASNPIGAPMGWFAILTIVLFGVAMAAINRYEFGRFD